MGTSKICTVSVSDDGDRIFCLWKEGSTTIAKGFYDFNRHQFSVSEFYTKKLLPGETPRDAITRLQQTLDIEMDWELKDPEGLIRSVEEGINKIKNKKKRKRNKRQ